MIKTADFRIKCGCRSSIECNHNLFIEIKALEKLVKQSSKEMEKKLIDKYFEGWRGWDECSIEILKESFKKHIEKGFEKSNMIDIMNLAAMIWNKL